MDKIRKVLILRVKLIMRNESFKNAATYYVSKILQFIFGSILFLFGILRILMIIWLVKFLLLAFKCLRRPYHNKSFMSSINLNERILVLISECSINF